MMVVRAWISVGQVSADYSLGPSPSLPGLGNTGLQGHSRIRSFTRCAWLCFCKTMAVNRSQQGPCGHDLVEVSNIYSLALYRKSIGAPGWLGLVSL